MTTKDGHKEHRGRELLFWLAMVARKIREDAGISPETLAVGGSGNMLRRFERAETWPQELEDVLWLYAWLDGSNDPRVILRRALDLWQKHGEAPPPPLGLESHARTLELQGMVQHVEGLDRKPDRARKRAASK